MASCSISADKLLERFCHTQLNNAIFSVAGHLANQAALCNPCALPFGSSGMRLVAPCVKRAINDGLSSNNLVIHQLGTTEVESTDGDDKALLKVKIKNSLADIIVQEKLEARKIDAEHQKRSWFGKELAVRWHFVIGLASAGADLAQQAKEVYDVVSVRERLLRIARSAYKATVSNNKGFTETFVDEQLKAEKRELIEALGFDPTSMTIQQFQDAFEVAELIWDDIDMRALLARFGAEYVQAQHKLEIAEMAGGVAFEVVLTLLLAAVTAGAGLAASAAAQTRHVGKFGKVGKLLMEFGEVLRDIKRRAKSRGVKANKGADAKTLYSGGETVEVRTTLKPESSNDSKRVAKPVEKFESIELDSNGNHKGAHNAGPHTPEFKKWVDEGGTVKYNPETDSYKYGKAVDTSQSGSQFVEIEYKPGPPDGDRYPDFSEHSFENVKIQGMKGVAEKDIVAPETGDFSKAWEKIASEQGDGAVENYGIKRRGARSAEREGTFPDKSPRGYTWHHLQDGESMVLLDKNVHNSFPHKGGASHSRG